MANSEAKIMAKEFTVIFVRISRAFLGLHESLNLDLYNKEPINYSLPCFAIMRQNLENNFAINEKSIVGIKAAKDKGFVDIKLSFSEQSEVNHFNVLAIGNKEIKILTAYKKVVDGWDDVASGTFYANRVETISVIRYGSDLPVPEGCLEYKGNPCGFFSSHEDIGLEALLQTDAYNKQVEANIKLIVDPAMKLLEKILVKDGQGRNMEKREANKVKTHLHNVYLDMQHSRPPQYGKNYLDNLLSAERNEITKQQHELSKKQADNQEKHKETLKAEAIVYLVSNGKQPVVDFDLLDPIPAANKLAAELEAKRLTPPNEKFCLDNWSIGHYHNFKEPNVYPKPKPPGF
jgi:hypothetical protein